MTDKSIREEHPSYGMVQITRQTGSSNLFGSGMRHSEVFCLRIKPGIRDHHLNQDWYHSNGRSFIEINLSPAQFVSMITTMNIGAGVPCTITRIGTESVESCPPQFIESERIRRAFKEEMLDTAQRLGDMLKEADEILEKKTVNKSDRGALRSILVKAKRFFDDHSPFAADQFERATSLMTAQAKADIEDFITVGLQRAGAKALSENGEDISIISLPENVGHNND